MSDDPVRSYAEALNRLDPLRGEPLFRLLDPLPRGRPLTGSEGEVRPLRAILLYCALMAVVVVCCSVPSSTLGGRLCGAGGLQFDLKTMSVFLIAPILPVLILVGRRQLGLLLIDVKHGGIVSNDLTIDPSNVVTAPALRALEHLTRPAWAPVWFVVIWVANAVGGYYVPLSVGPCGWISADAVPGSLLYFLHVGNQQPTVAGIVNMCVLGPLVGYLWVLVVRLYVVFACICAVLARDQSLRILPTHPDGVGGLLPLGRTALFLSVFTLVAGLSLAGITLQAKHEGLVTPQIWFFWACYLCLAPFLFFTPVLPLRSHMAKARRDCLLAMGRAYATVESRLREQLAQGKCDSEASAARGSLVELAKAAGSMSVWPFDRKSLRRFTGIVLSPLAPMLIQRVVDVVRSVF